MEKNRKGPTMGRVVDDLDCSTPSQLECSGMSIGHSDSACLIDPTEIKQETCIKEEDPDSVGHLIDVPVANDNGSQQFHNLNEHDGEDDSALLGVDDVKIEPKQEIDCKKEKETKTNADSREDAAQAQQNQQPQPDNGGNPMGNSIPKNNRKAHKCDLCEYSTKYRSHLKRHLRTNEKPYGCKYCAK
ncbi:zinc finger and BTB domain-containing protein 8A-like, partial [Contarinia nasturtii]|uniref:zinc finger and BTB domain-containing protein 8A-like n=1 Tax=Contarinia nasturtii TaxID=265458 RepID=UPI0012D4C37B